MKIVAIYDNRGKTADRYTVITDELEDPTNLTDVFMGLGLSDNCNMPNGVSMWGGILRDSTRYNAGNSQWRTRTDLGRRISFESLPEHIQEHVAYRMWQ